MEIKELDVVRIADGREATILEVFDTDCLVDVGDSPETWDTIFVKRTDIVEVIWTSSGGGIAESDGDKPNPKRLSENASDGKKTFV